MVRILLDERINPVFCSERERKVMRRHLEGKIPGVVGEHGGHFYIGLLEQRPEPYGKMEIDGNSHHLRIAYLVYRGLASLHKKSQVKMEIPPPDEPDRARFISLDKADNILLGIGDGKKPPQGL
jgi:hypothetical protein